jgi:parallel beta-helix repeat protein
MSTRTRCVNATERSKMSGPVMGLTRAGLCRSRELLLPLVGALCLIFLGSSTAKAGTPILGPCPVIIVVPGEYDLASDLGPCAGDGIWIQVSNVTLHLDGHTITGTNDGASAGIRAEAPGFVMTVTNVRIKGPGVVQTFGNGVLTRNSSDSQMKQVTVTANSGSGVVVGVGAPPGTINSHWQFVSNAVTNNGVFGIVLASTSDCIAVQNDASNNAAFDGIVVWQVPFWGTGISSDNNVVSNTANGNGRHGIYVVQGSVENLITANSAANNGSFDLEDDNPSCDGNNWQGNKFGTANQSCIH